MKKISLLAATVVMFAMLFAQITPTASVTTSPTLIVSPAATPLKLPASKVDFDAFDSLTSVVKEYRKTRLIDLAQFVAWSREPGTIILDARSTEMYNRKHLKGAIHINFSDFTQAVLRRFIPKTATRILIYCNNNFADDPIRFATKSYAPPTFSTDRPITLALNIPTFINLYGYGYKNVYELADLVSVYNASIEFEGTDVPKPTKVVIDNKPGTIKP